MRRTREHRHAAKQSETHNEIHGPLRRLRRADAAARRTPSEQQQGPRSPAAASALLQHLRSQAALPERTRAAVRAQATGCSLPRSQAAAAAAAAPRQTRTGWAAPQTQTAAAAALKRPPRRAEAARSAAQQAQQRRWQAAMQRPETAAALTQQARRVQQPAATVAAPPLPAWPLHRPCRDASSPSRARACAARGTQRLCEQRTHAPRRALHGACIAGIARTHLYSMTTSRSSCGVSCSTAPSGSPLRTRGTPGATGTRTVLPLGPVSGTSQAPPFCVSGRGVHTGAPRV